MILHSEWTAERVAAFQTVVRAATDRVEAIRAFEALTDHHRDWMAQTVLCGAVSLASANAYTVPVFSPAMCDDLLQWADGQAWQENTDEEPDFRMDEIVIAHHDPAYDEQIKTALMFGLAPYLACIFGALPLGWSSLQYTRYDASRAGGAYHVDSTSDYTAVIALNDDFEGGGTRMASGVFGSVLVPPVPRGHALIFRGRQIFHKGEAITRGTRKLLTAWMADDPVG